jgi:hypothetical protein
MWDHRGSDGASDLSSSEVSVATITADGLASTAGQGSTMITAKMNDISGTATLNVD